ncbi:hypothetical protein L1887_09246 [Cichorium endivia]|nr:hypothetical protein L1887_09246 [Cichorium endivia]
MGPIRRSKSKKKAEQPTTSLVTPPLSQPQPSDWWHDFSKRFHGSFSKSTDSQSFESMFKMPAFCDSDDDQMGLILRDKISLHLSGGSRP